MPLAARGLPNKMIAFKLGTGEKTIKVHRARIMRKMQVQSLADLVRLTEKLKISPNRQGP
jgi:FixJ family two-component response regulator